MRKTICGFIAVISFIGVCAIPNLFDAGYISFAMSNVLIVILGLLFVVGLYGSQACISQHVNEEVDENGEKIH